MSSQQYCPRKDLDEHQHSIRNQNSISRRKVVQGASEIANHGASLGKSHQCSRNTSATYTSNIRLGEKDKLTNTSDD
ncbi:hypothetical protein IG631_17152 [Alternaria alternata]|nr:hypothetical protein IG631_17152 [Alternaria alternata]